MSDENLENKFRKYLDSFASEDFINKSRFDIFEAGYKLAMEEIKILKTSRNFGKTAMLDNLYGKQRLKGAEAIIKHFKNKIGIPLFSDNDLRLRIMDILKENKKYVADGIVRKITK